MELEKKDNVQQDEIHVAELLLVVWKKRWFILISTLGFGLIGLVLAFSLPRSYEATATVFPVSNSGSSSLSDYAGLADFAGISLPLGGAGNSPGKTVNALLSSRLLIETLVRDMGLVDKIKVPGKTPEERERQLVEMLRISMKTKEDVKTGVISVSFELNEPELAQDVTNRALDLLDRLLVEKSFTSNRKKKEQLDRQIEDQGKKLTVIQNEMASFQKETTMLNPTTQAGKIVDAYTSMIQQKMELELQLATAQTSYSADNPRVTLLKTQLLNIEDQINKVKNEVDGDLPSLKLAPENLIRYQNLTRNLEIATKIYSGLLASAEQGKLEADKDQVYIEVLDRAILPESGKPSRVSIVAMALVLGFAAAIGLTFSLPSLAILGRRLTSKEPA